MKRQVVLGIAVSLTFAALVLGGIVQAQSPREQLQTMVEQLQKTPTDNSLRERIIKLGAEIKPAPALPPEAKRPFVMAVTYQKEAKKPDDFALAIAAYQDALKVAPWWGDTYYNLSVSLESAGRLDEAKHALELYLLTKPEDAEEAQNHIYALDAKKNLAAKQAAEAERAGNSPEARAAKQKEKDEELQAAFEAALPKLNGARYKTREHEPGYWQEALIDGRTLLVWTVRDSRSSEYRLNGPRTGPQRFQLINPEIFFANFYCLREKADYPGTLFVHPDGSRLTVNRRVCAGGPYDFVRQ